MAEIGDVSIARDWEIEIRLDHKNKNKLLWPFRLGFESCKYLIE